MTDNELLKKIVSLRREIHRHPELGNQEFKTAALVEKTLKSLGIRARRLTKTGVVGEIPGAGKGRCILLRADMDALPLQEPGNKPYRSQNPGVMHACGHDAHVAMLLGAAMTLKKEKFSGSVKLIFQPNEEGAGGAVEVIQAGLMARPKVDAVFGLHVNPRIPAGSIGLKEGPLMAAVDKFTIEINGVGGHAAYPHEGKDAIPVACEVVNALQTVVARKIDPLDAVVLTVGTIQGGSRYNILAGKVALTGTVRTLSEDVHRQIPAMMKRVIDGVCKAHGVGHNFEYEVLGSVLSNDRDMMRLARRAAEQVLPESKIQILERASMGGEDFAEYLKDAPGCFIYIGTGKSSSKGLIPWHHPEFDIDESAMLVGSKLLTQIAKRFLN